MVFVILRTGKVLQYNTGGAIAVEDGTITIRTVKDKISGEHFLIARIPLDIVERAEFNRPCKVMKVRNHGTKGTVYEQQ